MSDVQTHNLQLVLPAFAPFFILPLVTTALLGGPESLPSIFFLSDRVETLFHLHLLKPADQSPQVDQTCLPGLDGLAEDGVTVLVLGHVLDLGDEEFVHAGVGVGVGELEEVVAVEIGHLLPQPLVLHPIQLPIQCQLLPTQLRVDLLAEVVQLPRYFLDLQVGNALSQTLFGGSW